MKKLIWIIILVIIIVAGFYLFRRTKSSNMTVDKNYTSMMNKQSDVRPSYG